MAIDPIRFQQQYAGAATTNVFAGQRYKPQNWGNSEQHGINAAGSDSFPGIRGILNPTKNEGTFERISRIGQPNTDVYNNINNIGSNSTVYKPVSQNAVLGRRLDITA